MQARLWQSGWHRAGGAFFPSPLDRGLSPRPLIVGAGVAALVEVLPLPVNDNFSGAMPWLPIKGGESKKQNGEPTKGGGK